MGEGLEVESFRERVVGGWDEEDGEIFCWIGINHSCAGRSCGKETIGRGGGGGNDEMEICGVALFDCSEACKWLWPPL